MQEKRRIARIPIACAVVVREKLAVWSTETEDLGARGCRIALKRPMVPGAIVQLRFERGEGTEPLEVVGQVVWARKAPPLLAGIAFVGLPSAPSGARPRNWIDALVVAQLRRALEAWPAGARSLARLGEVTLNLGAVPDAPLDAGELAVVRLARSGATLAALCHSLDGLRSLIRLLDRGVVSVCRTPSDPEGWKRALARLGRADVPVPEPAGQLERAGGAPPVVIVPPLPETAWRAEARETLVQDYLRSG